MDNSDPTGSHKPVIFFDVETNGLSRKSSVLSITAIKALFNGNDIDTIGELFTRFYYRNPGEPENPEALAVNGLTDTVIRKKRDNARYAEHFTGDTDFKTFCAGVNHYVGHHIAFDRKFIFFPLKHCFCTMKENLAVIKLPRYGGGLKYPRLSETAAYYGLALETDKLHGSEYDARLTYEIFREMLERSRTKQRIREFLNRR
ncbi:MAG: 3'-5' exonuclease [Spirochaetaceae bacterium]|jgi:DNA polymerase-3 subunit epsilon|nr:3'-5' exonuclease [Spirochaetaceae bacterium]